MMQNTEIPKRKYERTGKYSKPKMPVSVEMRVKGKTEEFGCLSATLAGNYWTFITKPDGMEQVRYVQVDTVEDITITQPPGTANAATPFASMAGAAAAPPVPQGPQFTLNPGIEARRGLRSMKQQGSPVPMSETEDGVLSGGFFDGSGEIS